MFYGSYWRDVFLSLNIFSPRHLFWGPPPLFLVVVVNGIGFVILLLEMLMVYCSAIDFILLILHFAILMHSSVLVWLGLLVYKIISSVE